MSKKDMQGITFTNEPKQKHEQPPKPEPTAEPNSQPSEEVSQPEAEIIPPQNNQTTQDGASTYSTDHFDALLGEDDEIIMDDHGNANGFLTKEQFHSAIIGSLKMSGLFMGIEFLADLEKRIAADNRTGDYQAATEAIYDSCMDVPWLHWVIKPEGKWLPRIIAIYAAGDHLVKGVALEIAQKKAMAEDGAQMTDDGDIIRPTPETTEPEEQMA